MLTAIKCNCELLADDPSLGGEARADVAEISRTADRAAALTRQLLAFSRKQALRPHVFDLNVVIAEMEQMLRRIIAEDVVLVTRADAAPCRVLADAAQMEQVVMNLAVNARDAMPDGGVVTVETRRETVPAPRRHRHGTLPGGRYVVLSVSDAGTGMDAGTMAHLFEPFFTTKERGKGTGLGLSTVYGIVSQCGGHVAVSSRPGAGSTFSVYLPEAEEAAPPR
jgi:signal transduction histidine kinase